MRHIPGIDRSQVLLLPEAVDDYVGRDNPVRFIDAFVDGLDLAAAGFERAAPKATGRPGYDPADLLKLYIYGYLNRVRSSRRLEAESKRNLEVIWLLRRLSPDFKTIADFRRINRAAFRQVFREFVRLCRELELFGRELVAVDGTRIKAVNSRKRNFTKAKLEKALAESDERLSRYLDRLDEADGQDEGGTGGGEVEHIQEKIAAIQGRRERFEEHRDALAASGEGQLSLTDPDSRAMYGSRPEKPLPDRHEADRPVGSGGDQHVADRLTGRHGRVVHRQPQPLPCRHDARMEHGVGGLALGLDVPVGLAQVVVFLVRLWLQVLELGPKHRQRIEQARRDRHEEMGLRAVNLDEIALRRHHPEHPLQRLSCLVTPPEALSRASTWVGNGRLGFRAEVGPRYTSARSPRGAISPTEAASGSCASGAPSARAVTGVSNS